MSRRSSIVKALAEKLKDINGDAPYKTNLYNNAFPFLKFWDECKDFPAVYVSAGPEQREYLPGAFAWVFLNVSLKLYCKGDDSQILLENLLEDVERVIDSNRNIVYDVDNGYETTDISITSITTDEGLLEPYAVGEITLRVQFEKRVT
jgi:hypothetical protein